MIRNEEAVIELFGYWPKFCDASFTQFSYVASREIRVTISYNDAENSKSANIEILFAGIKEVQLNDFLTNNYIDEIIITQGAPHAVSIEACAGLRGTFRCTDVEVVNVQET